MKYIPADKLIAEVKEWRNKQMGFAWGSVGQVLEIITSLQQEQPEFPTTDEEIEKALASLPKVELPDKYKTPDWLFKQQEQPEVELDKEIDKFLYGAEFKRDCDGVHVPGVCMRDWKGKKYVNRDVTPNDMRNFARHFAEWGANHLNARKGGKQMNTPDKIYLNTPKIQPELDNTTWDTKTYADCENVEYIRKDALLGWAKKMEVMYPELQSFEFLIDKLNSL